ncbi:MAG TPA: ribonuclease HII [Steroidobacteraceae bacterium]|nr:ribonuclease HII [Steroidobacteraceae bacterium]
MSAARRSHSLLIAGVDEAGRGPLAGPVVAAAVILDPRRRIRGIRDSKVLDPEERERLALKIRETAIAWSVAWADVDEIDTLNILQATYLAMRRAMIGLRVPPGHVQVDGNRCPSFVALPWECTHEAIIDGDALHTCIGAASILAKTTRDRMMVRLDAVFPNFGFASHKGYSTPQHYEALDEFGPTPIHRRSFEPVRVAHEARATGVKGRLRELLDAARAQREAEMET